MNESQDRPLLEVYPWYLVGLLSILWGGLWFAVWAALRGTVAALVVASGSYSFKNASWLPWLVPVQLVLLIVSLLWISRDIRREKSPPPAVFALCILLLTTFAPTCFYMLARINTLSEYELTRSTNSVFFQSALERRIPDILAIIVAGVIAGYANVMVMRRKYSGIKPLRGRLIPMAWAAAALVAIPMGSTWGVMWGFLAMPAVGNAVSIYCFRERIRRNIRESAN